MVASRTETSRPALQVSREQVLAYRFSAQQLDRQPSETASDAEVLDIGVQDTGTDGARWALANRGVDIDIQEAGKPSPDLVLAWTLRGAPHVYRRADIAAVAAATTPYSSADAGKRIFDAAKPLRAAGIDPGDALDEIAGHMREIVAQPTGKGELSRELTARLDAPYLRNCRPCNAIHAYEQPFRLAALRAGLELQPATSPPVLQRIPGWRGPADEVPVRLDVVRAYLRLLGPATPKHVAGYLDAPVSEVKAHWPADVEVVDLEGERRWLLAADVDGLRAATLDQHALRLLSPFDLFLQARDREILVASAMHRKLLWPVLGRPGAIARGGQIVGGWRPRTTGGKLKLALQTWSEVPKQALAEQAERLATTRSVAFVGFTSAD